MRQERRLLLLEAIETFKMRSQIDCQRSVFILNRIYRGIFRVC
jgi:hypothetical protein